MKKVFRFLFYVLLVYSVVVGLIQLYVDAGTIDPECTDESVSINGGNDQQHQRNWELINRSQRFCASYSSFEEESDNAEDWRNKLSVDKEGYHEYWGEVYKSVVSEGKADILFLVDSLATLAKKKQLKKSELAEMVVTFVQDIPYSYIIGNECESLNTKGSPCLGNVKFGLLSPYEFIHSLKGDCDTRAILIYAILEALGFEPMIVLSRQYAHAMLALNLPSSGDYIRYHGKNYYFWETTAKGWPIGMLPPSTNNVNYWKIALVNEY